MSHEQLTASGYDLVNDGKTIHISSKSVCTGRFRLLAADVDSRCIVRFTDLMFGPDAETPFFQLPGSTIGLKVHEFMKRNWGVVGRGKYFMIPHNLDKLRRGGVKLDLPNVTYEVFFYLLNHLPHDVVVVDPQSKLHQSSYDAVNLSAVVRAIRQDSSIVIPPIGPGGQNVIQYQRGRGTPSFKETEALEYVCGTKKIIHVKLMPGKYDRQNEALTCYESFGPSVASLIHQFGDIALIAKPRLGRLYLVLDEFSGYAMYTAAAIKGYGLGPVTSLVCYYRGRYTIS